MNRRNFFKFCGKAASALSCIIVGVPELGEQQEVSVLSQSPEPEVLYNLPDDTVVEVVADGKFYVSEDGRRTNSEKFSHEEWLRHEIEAFNIGNDYVIDAIRYATHQP